MSETITPPAEPDGAPRMLNLDVLRGVAILGILFMNINDMGGPFYGAFGGDLRDLGWTARDQIAWWLREVLANGTARCLLEMLFGAGMVILTDRAAARMHEWRLISAYWRRNLVLFLFGLAHVFILLWPGDILHTYGLAALLVVLCRRMPARWMLGVGLVMAMLQLAGGSGYVATTLQLRGEVATLKEKKAHGARLSADERITLARDRIKNATRAKERAETAALVATENRDRAADVRGWVRQAWGAFLYIEKQFLEFLFVWEAASTMLIGAALFQWGVLQGAMSRRFYARLAMICYPVGLGLRAWGAYVQTRFDHLPSFAYPMGEVARLATTLGHVSLINWLLWSVVGMRLMRPFAAAGRTALSVYVAQTLVCLWVLFPPWGLALYGRLGWASLMLVATAVNAGLMVGACLWVRWFSIAPVEWAWRSIVAGRRLPFRVRGPALVGG